eukprot:68249-Rhodomonas_salina.1
MPSEFRHPMMITQDRLLTARTTSRIGVLKGGRTVRWSRTTGKWRCNGHLMDMREVLSWVMSSRTGFEKVLLMYAGESSDKLYLSSRKVCLSSVTTTMQSAAYDQRCTS